jgi:hypothetical protein
VLVMNLYPSQSTASVQPATNRLLQHQVACEITGIGVISAHVQLGNWKVLVVLLMIEDYPNTYMLATGNFVLLICFCTVIPSPAVNQRDSM